ncbi:DUF2314 domain-containing protein [Patiriisocius hiemis]|uniref:DUF2314 domain-containing protein n=1 Tax=Patiriisocius hiemis TaxID=3075604 RepID=A0ABU2YBJ6_9FLAO|nr:DUF2314 domain-containing protein [Constantimarinum sp. W242]MDT0555165.1 DUF2314 domain-containing protein [Constantimarinum sp. W242]
MIRALFLLFILISCNTSTKSNYDTTNDVLEWDKDNVVALDRNDKALRDSKTVTKDCLGVFKSKFRANKDSLTIFFVKVKVSENESIEHIWLEILEIQDKNSVGVVSNIPYYFKNISYLDTLSFDINKAEDISILHEDEYIFGNYLTKMLDEK